MRDEERRREKGKKELHRRQSKQAKRIRDVRFTSTDLFQTPKSFFIDLICYIYQNQSHAAFGECMNCVVLLLNY